MTKIKTTISRWSGKEGKRHTYCFFDQRIDRYDGRADRHFHEATANAERYREAIQACHPFDEVTVEGLDMNCMHGSHQTSVNGEEVIHMKPDPDEDTPVLDGEE